ncbi:hypothetical protein [Aquisphaera giovannonii]|nr:hypothetical protein [Aquisphaera giovannonii]
MDWNLPWDDPANVQLSDFSSFFCDDALAPKDSLHPFPETGILAITGPGTAFGDGSEDPVPLRGIPPQTILCAETRASGIPWPAPGDFDVRDMPHTINAPNGKGISGRYKGGFHVIFADAEVWFLSDGVPFDTLSRFFTVADAAKHNRDKLLKPFVLWGPGQY